MTYYQKDARQQGIASYTKKFVGTRLTRSLCSQSQMYNLQCEVCISLLAFIIADSFKKLFGQTESGFSITHPISCSRNGTLVNKLTETHSRSNSHRVKTANYWFLLVPSTTGRGTSIEINHPSLFTDDHRSDHRPGLEG